MRIVSRLRRVPRALPYDGADLVLVLAIGWAASALAWTLVKPIGPIGNWQLGGGAGLVTDPTLLTRIDPFFRDAGATSTAVTSLALKLFGVRVDTAMGRGSAIIATPDGIQASYGVGEEIVPGVTLKAVAIDAITIARGGVDERLFLDQSTAAPAATTSPVPGASPAAAVPGAASLLQAMSFTPREREGQVSGFTVRPQGASTAFEAAGFQPGDVVTAINGITLRAQEDASRGFANTGPDGIVRITVERGGQIVQLTTGGTR